MASIHTVKWKTKSGEEREAFRVSYSVKGRKRFRQFKSKRPAQRFAETIGAVRAQEAQETATGPLLATVAEDWLAAAARGRGGRAPLEPTTIAYYRQHVDGHILPFWPSLRIGKLTQKEVKRFRDHLLDKLSRPTAKKVLTTLRVLARYCVEEDIIPGDPTGLVTIRVSKRERKQIEIHSKAEVAAILTRADALASEKPHVWVRYRALLLVLLYGGLRLSEARGLPRGAVRAQEGTIRVQQRADRFGDLGAPKSASGSRTIHVPDVVLEALADVMKRHRHPLVFATRTGEAMDSHNVNKRCWGAIQDAAEVRRLNLHSARHFFASRQIELGCDPKELSELMGHSDPGFTLRVYGHLFRDRESSARRKSRAEAQVL